VKYVVYDGVDGKRKQEPVGYVMERMHCSLHEHLKHAKVPLKQLLSLLTQVALALAYTHANNVAHLDIKPENILLDESKSVAKLCDFGCAYFIQTTLRSTLTRRGTPFFMAPEMKPNDVKACQPFPVDVYAFGVTMMLLMDPDADCQQLTDCDWSRVRAVAPAVSQLGQRCTQRDPLQRPDMQQVHDELQRIAARLAVLESLLECAGFVPGEDCAELARALSAQGVCDAASLRQMMEGNPALFSAVGMSTGQQRRLTRYLNEQIAPYPAPDSAPAHVVVGGSATMAPPAAPAAAATLSLSLLSPPDVALIVRAAAAACCDPTPHARCRCAPRAPITKATPPPSRAAASEETSSTRWISTT
jgi:hypothetical protein